MDISDQGREVRVVVTVDRLIPGLEEMSLTIMASVEGQRVVGEQALHDLRKGRLIDLDREVKVIRHEAERKKEERRVCLDPRDRLKEFHPVSIIDIDGVPIHTTGHNVVNGAGEVDAWAARHTMYTIEPPDLFHVRDEKVNKLKPDA